MPERKITLFMDYDRVIHGDVQEPISEDYFHVKIEKIENPIKNDWKKGDWIKISKSNVKQFKFID